MKLIVGLGNPGLRYRKTRHNMGFMVIDAYAKKHHLSIEKEKFGGKYVAFHSLDQQVILLKPQLFINLSGPVVRDFLTFYKINLEDILVITDDLDLAFGCFKLKAKGTSGGHNGLKSIEQNLGSTEYKRLKLGISNDKNIDAKDYVLGKIPSEETELLNCVLNTSIDIIDDFLEFSFEQLMNKYNTKQ